MAANDVLALNANFATWQKNRMPGATTPEANPFEYYCVDQFLKRFAVSDDELLSGLVAGGQDGGIDALYFFVNRRLVEEDTELDPKAALKVNLLVMQVKETQGFSPPEIDKLVLFSDDLLDLSRRPAQYQTTYNAKLLGVMNVFKEKFQQIAGAFPAISIDYYYITKSDSAEPDDATKAAARVINKAKEHLSSATCEFHFVNAAKLWEQVQLRLARNKALVWHDAPLSTAEGLVGLVHLHEYWEFLKDEHGDLHESIFESNVRGFQQNTPVNLAIHDTLAKPGKADFWLLNNGITVLAQRVSSAGHKRVDIDDPQIVNGLQTSRQIFEYFKKGSDVPEQKDDPRRILVRVVDSQDEDVRDDVIRATNSQNKMPAEALRATDRIHRQIEALFHQYDLYYDRRKGFYKDQGKPIAKIVPVIELLQAILAIMLKRPDEARARPRDYIKDDDKYEQVFGGNQFDLGLYLKSILLYRRVASFLARKDVDLDATHQRNLRFYLAMYVAAAATKHAYAPPHKLLALDENKVDEALLMDCYNRVMKQYNRLARKLAQTGDLDWDQLAKGPIMLRAINTELKRRFTPKKKK
jgi:AIPR protein